MATLEETLDKAIEVAVKRANAYTDEALENYSGTSKLNTLIDSRIPKVNYKFVKWKKTVLTSSASSTEQSLTLTTTGKPVFLLVCGDGNPEVNGAWLHVTLQRGTTTLATQITQMSDGASANKVFSLGFIDTPSAGAQTYKATIALGNTSRSITLGEDGDINAPQFMAFEIH